MGCFFPIKAWPAPGGGRYVFNINKSHPAFRFLPVEVPCNQCKGCRLSKAMEWGIRCHHEAQFHEESCFITLTYNRENLPANYSVDENAFRLFLMRLRKKIYPRQIRFFGCGEYGDKEFRPHYHSIIFGYDFPDKRYHDTTKRGDVLYTSEILSDLWPYGYHTIGTATWKSAAYTARYTLKKTLEDDRRPPGAKTWAEIRAYREAYYDRIHPNTGELVRVAPEFLRMSRMPGLGAQWAQTFKSDWFPHDFVILKGKQYPVPKFYLQFLSDDERKFIENHRRVEAQSLYRKMERDDKRRYAKKIIREQSITQLVRPL